MNRWFLLCLSPAQRIDRWGTGLFSAFVLLAVIADAAARIQTSMSLLAGTIRDCDEGDSR